MKTKKLGNSDMHITAIGLGTWAIGGSWLYGWGEQDDQESVKTIHAALERGINWVDTAPAYGLGHSEEVTARAIRESSYEPFLFSKCGIKWDDQGQTDLDLSPGLIIKEIEASLSRMKRDCIDLYQIHWPTNDKDIESAWKVLDEARQQGKIRYLGVSNFDIRQMELVNSIAPLTSLQPPYSLLNRNVEKEILPYCDNKGIGVINYSPMASGLLSGKMTRERIDNMDDTDWRKKHENFTEPALSRHLALADLLKEIGKEYGATAGETAIAWTLANPAVTGAIVGMRHPGQIDGVIKAGSIALSDEDISRLNGFPL